MKKQIAQLTVQLQAIHKLRRKPLESAYAKGGLTGPQQSVMRVLVETPGHSLKEVSRRVGLSHSTVSGIIDRLEQRGMVERRVDNADRRSTRLYPSKAVLTFMAERAPALESDAVSSAMKRATPAQRAAILSGVGTLHFLMAELHREQKDDETKS